MATDYAKGLYTDGGRSLPWDPTWFESLRQIGDVPGEPPMTEQGVINELAMTPRLP